MMNDEKYHRLTCRTPFTDEQKAGFIARQLVETSQGTKGIADLMKQLLPDTIVVYSKASNVSAFRQENGFVKNRLVNDFHHAKDAYLNIVVGNVYFTKFTQRPINFIKELASDEKKYHYNLSKMFAWNVERNGVVAWNADNHNGSIKTVKSVMNKNTPIITRKSFIQSGQLYDSQPISHYKAKVENYVPRKNNRINDVSVYGGYSTLTPAYFIFIEATRGKKVIRTFESVSIYVSQSIKCDKDLIGYCENELGYNNVRIIANKIKKHSIIRLNGYYLYIVGFDHRKNVELKNAVSMALNQKNTDYVRSLEKAQQNIASSKDKVYSGKMITKEDNLKLYNELCIKHANAIFSRHPKPLSKILINGKEKFELLSIEQQIDMLINIIGYTKTTLDSSQFSLFDIDGPKDMGRIRISGNMTHADELLLIHRSISGAYERTINLLEVK